MPSYKEGARGVGEVNKSQRSDFTASQPHNRTLQPCSSLHSENVSFSEVWLVRAPHNPHPVPPQQLFSSLFYCFRGTSKILSSFWSPPHVTSGLLTDACEPYLLFRSKSFNLEGTYPTKRPSGYPLPSPQPRQGFLANVRVEHHGKFKMGSS